MEPYIGQIMLFAGNFAPSGWALCNGQELSISQNTALYRVIGTTYGGNGHTTFALPNLQGRVPIHQGALIGGNTYEIGKMSGSENVTLTQTQIPAHTHQLMGNNMGGANTGLSDKAILSNQFNEDGDVLNTFYSGSPNTMLSPESIRPNFGGESHNNMQPYLVMNYCIALEGIFPSST